MPSSRRPRSAEAPRAEAAALPAPPPIKAPRRRRAPARRLAVGAETVSQGGVHFRVWAPRRAKVEVVFDSLPGPGPATVALTREPGGYFSGMVAAAGPGALYRYLLDGEGPFPDPASRFQPEGPHGPSRVEDPSAFRWTDGAWPGLSPEGQVLYEMHVGTFTPEGTWEAAARLLPALAEIGITAIEMMPIADFPGRFGWGYDGVDLYAPTRLYGEPNDLRRFLDRAHATGIGVILDVVYNHLGPDGNYLKQFSESYFTDRYTNDWGEAINFDGPDAGPVRELFIENAGYWIDELHFDGLRLDATQDVHDASPEHVLVEIARRARRAAGRRSVWLVTENEPQDTRLVRPLKEGGYGLDSLWNDDFHHSAMVAMTGRNEAYYTDYQGSPQELVSAVKHGYLYQGQRYAWQRKHRGTPTRGLPPWAFVAFIQNHDQVANSARGERCHFLTSPGRYRAMTALTLLGPATPMLFQGQEHCASAPFLYFADHGPELANAVREGRHEFLSQFPSLAAPEVQALVPDPADPATFETCKLDPAERERHAPAVTLHRDLLRLRREDPTLAARGAHGLDGAVLGAEAFVLRFFGGTAEADRLLVVNLGHDLDLVPAPEPLLAPPPGRRWVTIWTSEDPCYGGGGNPEPEGSEGWRLPGRAAVLLGAEEEDRDSRRDGER